MRNPLILFDGRNLLDLPNSGKLVFGPSPLGKDRNNLRSQACGPALASWTWLCREPVEKLTGILTGELLVDLQGLVNNDDGWNVQTVLEFGRHLSKANLSWRFETPNCRQAHE